MMRLQKWMNTKINERKEKDESVQDFIKENCMNLEPEDGPRISRCFY